MKKRPAEEGQRKAWPRKVTTAPLRSLAQMLAPSHSSHLLRSRAHRYLTDTPTALPPHSLPPRQAACPTGAVRQQRNLQRSLLFGWWSAWAFPPRCKVLQGVVEDERGRPQARRRQALVHLARNRLDALRERGDDDAVEVLGELDLRQRELASKQRYLGGKTAVKRDRSGPCSGCRPSRSGRGGGCKAR
jgi:hypothetical protein